MKYCYVAQRSFKPSPGFLFSFPLSWHGGGKCGEPLGSLKASPKFVGFGSLWQVLFFCPMAYGYFDPVPTELNMHTLEMNNPPGFISGKVRLCWLWLAYFM